MLALLSQLRHQCAIGFVGGSNLVKQQEQLGSAARPVTAMFDFCFAENGLVAYRLGQELASHSFIAWIGEAKYQQLVNWILIYIAKLDIPVKRGTFVEFRSASIFFLSFVSPRDVPLTAPSNGMINVSPIGRNASQAEREAFEQYDQQHQVRATMIAALRAAFPAAGLTYSIGGQLSFDVFPTGWDKTYCLQHLAAEPERGGVAFKTIHFFGDKTQPGGNDYEIYADPRVTGHAVASPADTMAVLKQMFKL